MEVTLLNQKNIVKSQITAEIVNAKKLTPYAASIEFSDTSKRMVSCDVRELPTPMDKLLFNNQSRLAEIIDSDASLLSKLTLIVQEAVDIDDYE